MSVVNHSKCMLCGKNQHVAGLKNNENGIGKVCIDVGSCKARKLDDSKNNNHTTNGSS